ncbi:MAG: hypothetical protein KGN79_13040 [Acidobacteriota bacterium]|nr:hypothetical protein [Acidobacteriota bacterium]
MGRPRPGIHLVHGCAARLCKPLVLLGLTAPALLLLAGCGGSMVSANPSQSASSFSLSPGPATIDTNCTGCNSLGHHGLSVEQFIATLPSDKAASVVWSVSGGDPVSGAGSITAVGQYTPPNYLTTDQVDVEVTATLRSDPSEKVSSRLRVTPGFVQPLTPQNATLGPGGTFTVTATLAEIGGNNEVHFALAALPDGKGSSQGALGAASCRRSDKSFTTCTVTYTAPASILANSVAYIVATGRLQQSRTEAAVLINQAGVISSPESHQVAMATPMLLGSTGGNNNDFDAKDNTVVDCCSGTLGALVKDSNGRQYLLSNNHVLARSDQASVGDVIVQPGLIDNNCTPNGDGPGTIPVGALTGWLPISSSQTNVDVAIAQVASHSVDPSGSILELGARLPDGSLAAAPPGISSTNGMGETASLALRVAKSGRTTGLTCGEVSAIDVDVQVDYFTDCAETHPYLTKRFTNQIAISGNRFSDAGDSGSLIVDTANAEPVGLYFAGGIDAAGVSHGMANPAPEVLRELNAQLVSGMSYTFVGGADHPVSCLSFGNSEIMAAQAQALSDQQIARVQQALVAARQLINPSNGVLGVAMGKSSDQPGQAAVIVYVSSGLIAQVPPIISGVRTVVVPSTARAVSMGTAPMTPPIDDASLLTAAEVAHAVAVKSHIASEILGHSGYFAVGVGQSFDNPQQAALVIYVDRRDVPSTLPATLDGLRTRYILMDRLHVTRGYSAGFQPRRHCMPHQETPAANPAQLFHPRPIL